MKKKLLIVVGILIALGGGVFIFVAGGKATEMDVVQQTNKENFSCL
nr:hypothetical protein [Bacillus cereus]